jgi:hypothetical protein
MDINITVDININVAHDMDTDSRGTNIFSLLII